MSKEFFEKAAEAVGDTFGAFTRMIENGLTSMFGSANARFLSKLQPKVDAINALEEQYVQMSDEELKGQTDLFRKRLAAGETTDDILVEAFAVCREAGKRTIGLRHYDVQLIGGMVLHSGAIAEMMTGEGKTLVATLPAYLNALEGKGVHVVTVNDYLARRDMEWMGPLYMSLGLTVGAIQGNMPADERQKAYQCDITYGTNNEFGFDYLRDNMRIAAKGDSRYPLDEQQVQGRLHYAIVDEVDNILIDEARTPLIISGGAHDDVAKYKTADQLARQLIKDQDFEVNEKDHTTNLTDSGIRRAEHLAGVESFYTTGNMHWPHLIDNALKAHHLYKRDVNYVVKDGTIVIVDEFTGRPMEGRNWSDGLHQAVEAKEGVQVKQVTQTLATITLQNFFKLYDKLGGMTGTAMTEAGEFWKIYKLQVIAIPPNKPVQRDNHPDLIFRTEKEKYEAIVNEIERINKWDILELTNDQEARGTILKEDDENVSFQVKGEKKPQDISKKVIRSIYHKGCPVLVGTVSIEKSELISSMLDRRGIKHQLLNARPENIGREAEIISQAGRLGAVTIATNMAGRGTDIILGGNPETMAWSIFQHKYPTRLDVPQDEWNQLVAEIEAKEQMKAEGDIVRSLGGLHIIGSERHEARRIDLQLRGRCGRQGDPGDTRFFLSLEDDLMRIFAGDWVKNILTRLGMEDGQAIENRMVSKRIEGAQKKVEERNFDVRKSLLEYDEVMDIQRKRVYSYRQRILDGGNCKSFILDMIDSQIKKYLNQFLDSDYGASSFAIWANSQLGVEFEGKNFRSLDYHSAEEYALDHAKRMAESTAFDLIEENLPDDEDPSEWKWQELAKMVNARWKTTYRDVDLIKIGRDNLAEKFIECAEKFIERVDLSRGKTFLDPDVGEKTTVVWLREKFGIILPQEEIKGLEQEDILAKVRKLAFEKYREKEIKFPVMAGLLHFTVNDQNGKHYDREKIVDWARQRFDIELSLDELKNKQRAEIEQTLIDISRQSSDRSLEDYRFIDSQLEEIFQEQNINIEELTAIREKKIQKNERFNGHEEGGKLDRNDPKIQKLCDWLAEEFGFATTPAELCSGEVLTLKDRLESVVEDHYNIEMRKMERALVLQILDAAWKEHLLTMDFLRSNIGLRGYAQIDPKVEYKREGMRIFDDMWNGIYERTTNWVFRVEQLDERFVSSIWSQGQEMRHESVSNQQTVRSLVRSDQNAENQAAIDASTEKKVETIRNKTPRVRPNDLCPCGSGKKYKNCCKGK